MLRSIFSLGLIGLFSSLGYFCLHDSNRIHDPPAAANYLRPLVNDAVAVYKIPIIKVNGKIIGDQNATSIAHQKGIGFIEKNPGI